MPVSEETYLQLALEDIEGGPGDLANPPLRPDADGLAAAAG
jgi:hypothetical protein